MSSAIETCPTLEDLATFLDGKLAGKERSRVVSHLADCESCYAVFADAARLQLEEAEEEAAAVEAPVIPIRKTWEEEVAAEAPIRRKRFPAWTPAWGIPLAAMLLLGTAAIPLYVRYNRMPEMMTADLVDPAALAGVPSDLIWERDMRGPGDAGGLFSAPYEFLVGAHLVDLRLVLARNDSFQSAQVLSRILNQMSGISFVDEQKTFYTKAHTQIVENTRKPKELLDEAAQTEASLTEALVVPESPYLSFGKWTEAGRLSALAHQPAFFNDQENRRFPGWLLRKSEDLDGQVVASLGEIRNLVGKSNSSAYPYPVLVDKFKDILDHYQTEADVQAEGFESSP